MRRLFKNSFSVGGIAIFDREEEQQSRNDPCLIVYLIRSPEEGLPGSSK